MRTPSFFIIGAPKCGTTSLSAWLAAHPAIYMSPEKEPAHFAADLKPNRPDAAGYAALFAGADQRHRAVGEASTCYLFSQVAVPAILESVAAPRFIVCLRNPVEMARSLHLQELFALDEDVRAFEEAWRLQEARARGRHLPRTCREPWLLQYRARCLLGEQVARLLRRVRCEDVLFVLLDDVRVDPRREYLRVLRFLGVTDDGRVEFPALNRAKHTRSRLVKRAVRYASALRHSVGFGARLGLRPLVERWNARERPRPAIDEAMALELRESFSDDVRRLGALLERDLSHWVVPEA